MLPGSPWPKGLKICKNVKEYSVHLLSLIPASWQQALGSGFSGGLEIVVGFLFGTLLLRILDFISKGLVDRPKLC